MSIVGAALAMPKLIIPHLKILRTPLSLYMEAFSPTPPNWTELATHAPEFCCPSCHAGSAESTAAWINRRSPVMAENRRRKWQEFYQCNCGKAWWGWSDERTPNEFAERTPRNDDSDLDFDSFFGYF
jgi:hypothetical protein